MYTGLFCVVFQKKDPNIIYIDVLCSRITCKVGQLLIEMAIQKIKEDYQTIKKFAE